MAFYSTSVDEDGQETRKTFTSRSYTKSIEEQPSTPIPKKLASIIDKSNSLYKTVRYVNPAAFIEKAPETDNSQENSVNSAEKADDGDEDGNIVPALDINSDESFQSPSEVMYSYGKACEVSKIITKPDAFAAWLSAKKKMKYYETQRKKSEEDEKEREKNEKADAAKVRYNEWLARKSRMNLQQSSSIMVKTVPENKSKYNAPSNYRAAEVNPKPSNRSIPREEIENKFKEWLEKKLKKEKQQKDFLIKTEENKKTFEENRKEHSKLLYDKWLETAAIKPKPVPLNRGLFTLKGTISDIYINPDPWKSDMNIDRDDDDLRNVDYIY